MEQYKYYAFISYKSEDAEWAEWLQRRIEYYKLPTSLYEEYPGIPESLRPIFRDMSDLGSGFLPKELNLALDASRFLIVICSKNAIKSPWVNNEINHFINKGRTEQIIPFIVDGKPYSGGDNECFPKAIRDLKGTDNELLGININDLGKDAASVKVISRLLNLKFDALWGRYLKEEEKEKQRLIDQNNKLRSSKERASVNKAMPLLESGQNMLAARIALEILKCDEIENWQPLPEVERLLRSSIMGRQGQPFPLDIFGGNFKFSPDGKYLIIWNHFRVSMMSLDPYKSIVDCTLREWIGGPEYDINSKYIAFADTERIHLFNIDENKMKTIALGRSETIDDMWFDYGSNHNDCTLSVLYPSGTLINYSVHNLEKCTTIIDDYRNQILHSKDHMKVVYDNENDSYTIRDLKSEEKKECIEKGHLLFISNRGNLYFINDEGIINVHNRVGIISLYAERPIVKFWVSDNERSCVYSIKDGVGGMIVYYTPDFMRDNRYFGGYVNISLSSVEIKRYNISDITTLKTIGQRFIAIGGIFGIELYDLFEKKIIFRSELGDNLAISSDFKHFIIFKNLSSEPFFLFRDRFYHFPTAYNKGLEILTLDSTGVPIYYNLNNDGRIELISRNGASHSILLKSNICKSSLLDVCQNRQLAAFRVNRRPGFIRVYNGSVFEDSYIIIINLKDFRIEQEINDKEFQKKGDIRFSYNGKNLFSFNSAQKDKCAYICEIGLNTLTLLPLPSDTILFDYAVGYWAIAGKTRLLIVSYEGKILSELFVEKPMLSLKFIDDEVVFIYPYVYNIIEDQMIGLENAPEVLRDFSYEVDRKRDIVVMGSSDIEYSVSVYVWQLSSGKLLLNQKHVTHAANITTQLGDDYIYCNDMIIPFPSLEELEKKLLDIFLGYNLKEEIRNKYYLEA